MRVMAKIVVAMSLLCSLLAVPMTVMVTAADDAALLAFKTQVDGASPAPIIRTKPSYRSYTSSCNEIKIVIELCAGSDFYWKGFYFSWIN
jgi:hypothetical protein